MSDPENFDAVKLGCEKEIKEAFKHVEGKKDLNIELSQMLNEIGVAVTNELKTSEVKWLSEFIGWIFDVVKRLSESTIDEPKIAFFE